ncbi:MAG: hypothetical protein AAGA84_07960 [Pseudomonadota bacterium]
MQINRIASWGLSAALVLIAGCNSLPPYQGQTLDSLAEDYLVLELAMGEIDVAHVDAYFGPPALREQARQTGWTLAEIDSRADALSAALAQWLDADTVERVQPLLQRIVALKMRVAINQGQFVDFDTEAKALFGVSAPDYDDQHFEAILTQIDALLPGEAPLAQRVSSFRAQFDVPPDRLEAVFAAAMEECRKRTLKHIALPDNESFTIEYVSDKPWSGYNWYQGNAVSLIQINTDFPVAIDRAIDLGCHEGYPGHHTYNAIVERDLMRARGWVEFSLYPLFSPQSLVAEGSGNYGIEVAFPADERIAYERQVLFPLAGLDAEKADLYYRLQALMAKLSYAGNEAARDYLNGDIDADSAAQWLSRYTLTTLERARQRVRFIDTYRSYVINYNLGQDLVRRHVERLGGDRDARWVRFEALLKDPNAPAAIR